MKAVSAMKKLWWGANIYWVILLIYGGIKLFTYNFDTSELGETASYALIIMVLISASVLNFKPLGACGSIISIKVINMKIKSKKRRCIKTSSFLITQNHWSHKKLIMLLSTCLL